MVHRTTDLFFVLKFKHRVFCGRFTRESHYTSHATPATWTREPTHPRVSACSKNIKIVSYHRVRGCRAYGLLPLWLLVSCRTCDLLHISQMLPAQNFSVCVHTEWKILLYMCLGVNPLSPKSDQHQTSPRNINTSSGEKVMRINKMITKGKLL